jgi:CRISPR-associated protein (TIGR03984 family)
MTERIELSDEWLIKQSPRCGPHACILLEGYPATGFGIVSAAGIEWKLAPPEVLKPQDWDLFADLRLFGPDGEWHCWNDGAGWFGRFADKWEHSLPRRYPLWGKPVRGNGWWECRETRGAQVWVPQVATPPAPEVPEALYLKALLRVESEPDTGLAGITDMRLCGFSWEAKDAKEKQ